MPLTVSAKFRNGVLVPDNALPLIENESVELAVTRRREADDVATMLATLQDQARNRLKLDPEIVRQIAEDPAYNIENS